MWQHRKKKGSEISTVWQNNVPPKATAKRKFPKLSSLSPQPFLVGPGSSMLMVTLKSQGDSQPVLKQVHT